MPASCVPADDVETWVAAKLTTTTTTTTTEETRLPCSKAFFFSLSLSLSLSREQARALESIHKALAYSWRVRKRRGREKKK